MKKIGICLLLAVTLGATTSLFAQTPKKMEKESRFKQELKDSLQFPDAIADSVVAIHREFQPMQRQIFMDNSLSAADKKSKMKDIRMQILSRYKSAGLSDAQIFQLEAFEKKMHSEMHSKAMPAESN